MNEEKSGERMMLLLALRSQYYYGLKYLSFGAGGVRMNEGGGDNTILIQCTTNSCFISVNNMETKIVQESTIDFDEKHISFDVWYSHFFANTNVRTTRRGQHHRM